MCFAINGQKKSWVACFGLKIVAWHSNVNHFIELTLMSTSVYINISYGHVVRDFESEAKTR